MTSDIRIGTSGWHYPHWIGPFYPADTPSDALFGRYVEAFHTVEINNTFYQLPDAGTVAVWRATAPSGFLFSCKGSRYITHMKKLTDPSTSTHRFFDRVSALGSALGPILFQLPPHWHCDVQRLDAFLAALPRRFRYAFEFRDRSWFTDAVTDVLAAHRAAFCIFELGGERSPIEVTTDFVYVRLHGPRRPYEGRYDGRTLRGWARRFARWLDEDRTIYAYLDNDQDGHAPNDALRLRDMMSDS